MRRAFPRTRRPPDQGRDEFSRLTERQSVGALESQRVIAAWDGKSTVRLNGAADVVEFAVESPGAVVFEMSRGIHQ